MERKAALAVRRVYGDFSNPCLRPRLARIQAHALHPVQEFLLRDNQNHVRCDNQALLTLMSFIQRKLHPAIMMSGGQTAVKPDPLGPRLWRLRA
jgi:hypothetical protein